MGLLGSESFYPGEDNVRSGGYADVGVQSLKGFQLFFGCPVNRAVPKNRCREVCHVGRRSTYPTSRWTTFAKNAQGKGANGRFEYSWADGPNQSVPRSVYGRVSSTAK